MVTEQEGQSPICADGDPGRAREVILGDRCPLFLVVLTDIIRGHTADNGFYLLSIRIVVETRRRRAGDRVQAVFGILHEVKAVYSVHVEGWSFAVRVGSATKELAEEGRRIPAIVYGQRLAEVVKQRFAGLDLNS